ncbi:MAG: transcription antitermination factor NusB [Thermodesulfobacteriota bacterium]
MGIRRRAREFALQVLYQVDVAGYEAEQAFKACCENLCPPETGKDFSFGLVTGVVGNREHLDKLIKGASEHWTLKRMPLIDRNILRLAAFELLYCDDIPHKVSINEAIELSKRFGTEDSPSFINGVLDRIVSEFAKE